MRRQLIDRMADTTAFSILLFLSGLLVLPVLALGLLVSPVLIAVSLVGHAAGDAIAFVLLSLGGAIGIVGWMRARWGARTPERHNVGLTLAFLVIGIATALCVAAFVAYFAVTEMPSPWRHNEVSLATAAAFVVAHGVWVVAGIAGIEKLMFSYAVRTGRTFDAIPLAMLLVALGLTLAVLLALATLG